MEFGSGNCAIFIIKIETAERIELPNQESIRTFGEKENYKMLGNTESSHHQTSGDKKKKKKKKERK